MYIERLESAGKEITKVLADELKKLIATNVLIVSLCQWSLHLLQQHTSRPSESTQLDYRQTELTAYTKHLVLTHCRSVVRAIIRLIIFFSLLKYRV